MVWTPDLKSDDLEFKSLSDQELDLFWAVLGLTPHLGVYLLPVGIVKLLLLFEQFVSLAL